MPTYPSTSRALRSLLLVPLLVGVLALDLEPTAPLGEVSLVNASTTTDLAVTVSEARFESGTAELVVLARQDQVADSLSASVLLGDAPLLLVPSNHLPRRVRQEIERVLPAGGRVVLVGGPTALSPDIEAAVRDLGRVPVRIAGRDRVETSTEVARAVFANVEPSTGPRRVMLAVGWPRPDDPSGTSGWADAISGGATAAVWKEPILLTARGHLSARTRELLVELGVDEVTIVGGPEAVNPVVANQVRDLDVDVVRVSGEDRQATAWRLAEYRWHTPLEKVTAVPGWSSSGWVAGLTAAGLGADTGAPVVLARPDGTIGRCVDVAYVGLYTATPNYGLTANAAWACGSGPKPLPRTGTADVEAMAPSGRPQSWCGTMPIAVNLTGAPLAASAALQHVVEQIEATTGLDVQVRATTERAPSPSTRQRPWVDESGRPAAVLLSWPAYWPDDAIGWGTYVGRGNDLISGAVALDARVTDPETLTSLMLHEFGHVLGLGHVATTTEAMGPWATPPMLTWGPGEQYALAEQAAWCTLDGEDTRELSMTDTEPITVHGQPGPSPREVS